MSGTGIWCGSWCGCPVTRCPAGLSGITSGEFASRPRLLWFRSRGRRLKSCRNCRCAALDLFLFVVVDPDVGLDEPVDAGLVEIVEGVGPRPGRDGDPGRLAWV